MTTTYERNGLVWIDLESPTPEELDSIRQKYSLHPLVVQELSSPSDRPKVDLYENLMYLILHFPALGRASVSLPREEIDFLIGKDFLVTVHYQPVDVLIEVGGLFEVDSILHRGKEEQHAGLLFFTIIEKLYASLEERLEMVSRDLDLAKRGTFGGEERAMVQRLSIISRTLLDFRIAMKSHGAVWESFNKAGAVFFEKKFSYYLAAISGEYNKVWNMLEGNKEVLSDLRETNDSLLNIKMNETMVHLTMMAFVVFPLTLIAGIFSMSAREIPIVGSSFDFWKIIAIMGCATVITFAFFKYRRWL